MNTDGVYSERRACGGSALTHASVCRSIYAPDSTTSPDSWTYSARTQHDSTDTTGAFWEGEYAPCTGCEFCSLPSTSPSAETDPDTRASRNAPEARIRSVHSSHIDLD